jgi:hypothetical protein
MARVAVQSDAVYVLQHLFLFTVKGQCKCFFSRSNAISKYVSNSSRYVRYFERNLCGVNDNICMKFLLLKAPHIYIFYSCGAGKFASIYDMFLIDIHFKACQVRTNVSYKMHAKFKKNNLANSNLQYIRNDFRLLSRVEEG